MNLGEYGPEIISATIAAIGTLLLRSFDLFSRNVTMRLDKLEQSVEKAMTAVTELVVKQQVDQAEIHKLREKQECLERDVTEVATTVRKCRSCNE